MFGSGVAATLEDDGSSAALRAAAPATSAQWRPRRWLAYGTCVVAALVVGATLVDVLSENGYLVKNVGLGPALVTDLAELRWWLVLAVVALGGAHYLAAGLAARAAAGLRLPVGEVAVVQLAAAAANRITPFGAGGAAVNVRYFTRRGRDGPGAVSAVGCLHVLGGISDLLTLALLVAMGRWIGLPGTASGAAALAQRASSMVGVLRSPWLWAGVAVAVLVAATVPPIRRAVLPTAAFWRPARELATRPLRLGLLVVSSTATTLVLAIAFVVSTVMVGGVQPQLPVGSLLVAFFVAGAAASAIPVPSGIGSTEAALVAVLVVAGVPVAHGAETVLAFRLITFWLPALLGLLVTRPLRRAGAL